MTSRRHFSTASNTAITSALAPRTQFDTRLLHPASYVILRRRPEGFSQGHDDRQGHKTASRLLGFQRPRPSTTPWPRRRGVRPRYVTGRLPARGQASRRRPLPNCTARTPVREREARRVDETSLPAMSSPVRAACRLRAVGLTLSATGTYGRARPALLARRLVRCRSPALRWHGTPPGAYVPIFGSSAFRMASASA